MYLYLDKTLRKIVFLLLLIMCFYLFFLDARMSDLRYGNFKTSLEPIFRSQKSFYLVMEIEKYL